ncbi:cytochrome C [Synechococcus sp. BS56D]|uniref:c-type cytochrome n=1 Tax=unclassified Synechococcus TaxID=2626047 RepID=UPI00103D4834|nr:MULTISPECIES: c-type cytochrome [unclassified Synechococcus]TCD57015.1 cytochrome C [Synechococcus sp. BS55D]TCD58694.1 cytochrome C [Synechococcus sp. BS56D]
MRILVGAVFALLIGLLSPIATFAADAAHGAQIFSANCAACHIGGGNVVNGQRTLQQADLDAYLANYGSGHESAIAYQVTNGKNAMPAFGGKLSETDIADVAAYVDQQAGNGWS